MQKMRKRYDYHKYGVDMLRDHEIELYMSGCKDSYKMMYDNLYGDGNSWITADYVLLADTYTGCGCFLAKIITILLCKDVIYTKVLKSLLRAGAELKCSVFNDQQLYMFVDCPVGTTQALKIFIDYGLSEYHQGPGYYYEEGGAMDDVISGYWKRILPFTGISVKDLLQAGAGVQPKYSDILYTVLEMKEYTSETIKILIEGDF